MNKFCLWLGNMNVLLSCRHNTGAVSLWGYPMRERFNELTIARVTLWQDTWGERQVSGVRDTYKKLILTSQWIRLTRKKTLPIFTVSFTFIKISTIRVKIDIFQGLWLLLRSWRWILPLSEVFASMTQLTLCWAGGIREADTTTTLH